MNLKFEVVITVWEAGVFVIRDKVHADSTDSLKEQLETAIDGLQEKLDEINARKYKTADDDDIPF